MDWSDLEEERWRLKLMEKYQCLNCILQLNGDHAVALAPPRH